MPYGRSYFGRGYGRKWSRMGTYRRANFVARKRLGSRFRRRSIFRTGGNYNQVLALPRSLAISQGPEKKYLDTRASAGTTVFAFGGGNNGTGAAFLQLCNGLILGTAATQRIGRQITMKSLLFRMVINASAAGGPGVLRVLLVIDHQANGAAMTTVDLFEQPAVADVITSPLNLSNRERFRILMDKLYNIGGDIAGSSVEPDTVHIEKFKKLNLITTYNGGNAGNVTDIATNSLYLVCLGTATAVSPVTNYDVRIRFTDA
jgi:hypothetical protein